VRKKTALLLILLFANSIVILPLANIKAQLQENEYPNELTISSWSIKTIDENAVGAGLIDVDSNNQPHIAYDDYYLNNETQALRYASLNNSGWGIQTVTSQYGAWDFALDSQNNPHILCVNGSDLRDLVYASWTGSNWTFQTVESQLYSNQNAALALDSAGNPHVAYSYLRVVENQTVIGEGYVLKYASWTNSGWHFEIIDSDIAAYEPFSLSLDAAGKAHIMYFQSQKLVYAVSSSSGWNKQTVLENVPFGNMVLDSNGYPDFIYLSTLDDPDNALMFSRWNGSAWSTQEVTSNGSFNSINFGFLALDSYNYPHIDFHNNDALMYAAWNGTSWNIQTVTSTNTSAPGPLVIDSVGNPHISYGGIWTGYFRSYAMYATTAKENFSSAPNSFSIIVPIALVVLIIAVVCLLLFRRHRKTAKKPYKQITQTPTPVHFRFLNNFVCFFLFVFC
jgi:hypothetical protein